jgi:predicted methyltransferase
MRRHAAAYMLTAAALLLLPQAGRAQSAADYQSVIAAPDRSDADRKTDQRRKPAEMLAFIGVKPGMAVLDMGADAGYSSELMARAVGPTGKVYAQEGPNLWKGNIKDRFEARMKEPAMKNVTLEVRPFDAPLPPDVKNIDVITYFFAYHDTTAMADVDRKKMNKAMFDALKPGGILVVADHAGPPGGGATTGNTLHRIEESTLKQEVLAAGFKQVGEANFLRDPKDPHTEKVFGMPSVDEFVVKFQKP